MWKYKWRTKNFQRSNVSREWTINPWFIKNDVGYIVSRKKFPSNHLNKRTRIIMSDLRIEQIAN